MKKNINYLIFGVAGLLLFISNPALAQNYTVTNLEELLNSSQNFQNVTTSSEILEVKSLVYDLNPTVFISDSGINSYGEEAPVKAEFSSADYKLLEKKNSAYNAVKLLSIKLQEPEDYNSSIDLSKLRSFQNLKYILVECSFNCSLARIQNMFSNTEDVQILYVIATPE